MEILATSFEVDLLREGLASKTIQLHLQRLQYFKNELTLFNSACLNDWIVRKRRDGWKNNSINSYLKTAKKLGKLYNIDGFNNARYLPANETKKATLSDKEIVKFLKLRNPYKIKQRSHRARFDMFTMFFTIQAYTGARPQEVSLLTIDDIDFGNNRIMIHGKKTHKYRFVPIPPSIKCRLQKYINDLDRHNLFVQCHQQNWSKQFKMRIEMLKIKRGNLTAYSFRHSFATRLVETDGVNLFDVKSLLGHSKLQTTEAYYHMSSKRLEKAIKKDPLNKKTSEAIICDLKDIIENNLNQYCGKVKYSISYKSNHLSLVVNQTS